MSHHHHCHEHEGESCSCCQGTCSHGHHHHDHDHEEQGDFAHLLLEMADEAWMEVLKEKIKEQIVATSGPHLTELAKLVADSNKMRWKHKMASQKACADYTQKMHDYFSRSEG